MGFFGVQSSSIDHATVLQGVASKELVKAMNGIISVTSRPGEGSSFILRLPRAEGPVVAGSPEREQEHSVSGQGQTDALKHTLPG
jgi:hypothetical protein